jgi:hypothetical protein
VDKFPEITGEIEFRGTSIGEHVSCILVRDTARTKLVIIRFDLEHQLLVIIILALFDHRFWNDDTETIFRAVSLTSLRKGAMAMSHQLMGASAGDTLDLEGKINVLEA